MAKGFIDGHDNSILNKIQYFKRKYFWNWNQSR